MKIYILYMNCKNMFDILGVYSDKERAYRELYKGFGNLSCSLGRDMIGVMEKVVDAEIQE